MQQNSYIFRQEHACQVEVQFYETGSRVSQFSVKDKINSMGPFTPTHVHYHVNPALRSL